MLSSKPKTPRVMNWSLQPRPRSPEQFISMMSAVVKFNGVKWWEKDEDNEPVNQIAVLNAINELPDFSLIPKSESVMQGRTYVTMNPPTLGFLYISDDQDNSKKKLIVTQAGLKAAEGENLQLLFLRQMLKWQYPSYVHGGSGGKGPAHFPLKDKWSIHPFLATLEITKKLGHLSKDEMATYVLTLVKDQDVDRIIKEILSYRKEIDSCNGAREKKERRFNILKNKMREVYSTEIEQGRYKKRQENPNVSKEEMIDNMLEAKMRNNIDYTDTIMRYFRFTGLFRESSRWHNLKINNPEEWKVDEIIKNKSDYLDLNPHIDDVKKFYEKFGDPNEPRLPWETNKGLKRSIYENFKNCIELLGFRSLKGEPSIKTINNQINFLNTQLDKKGYTLCESFGLIESEEFEELIKYSLYSQRILKEIGRMVVSDNFRTDEEFETTKKMFSNVIENKKWGEPYMEVSLLLEWAMYRSIYGIGGEVLSGYGPKLNYDGTEPIFTAMGNAADVIADFEKSYLLLEGTITSGARQYDTEAEPVTRHVARFIETKSDNKPTLTFFIARDLNENVKEYFAIYNIYHKHPIIKQYLNIIPMDIDRYNGIIGSIRDNEILDGSGFEMIVNNLDELRKRTLCEKCGRPEISSRDWYNTVHKIIDEVVK